MFYYNQGLIGLEGEPDECVGLPIYLVSMILSDLYIGAQHRLECKY